MESTGLLMLIFGIWVAVVIPVWWREHKAGSNHQVAHFRSAMERLREGQVLPGPVQAATVDSKRAPKAGHLNELRQRGLRRRRVGFALAVASFPVALALQLSGLVGAAIWVMPPLAVATFVAYARYTLSQLQRAQSVVTKPAEPMAQSARPHVSRSLSSGLAAVRKIAMRRLVETEPKLKTDETPAWQPASELGSPWSAPAPILPSYVAKSAAADAVVAEPVAPVAGVDGNALIEAARAQRDLAALAEQVAAAEAAEARAAVAAVDDDTSEIVRIIGA